MYFKVAEEAHAAKLAFALQSLVSHKEIRCQFVRNAAQVANLLPRLNSWLVRTNLGIAG